MSLELGTKKTGVDKDVLVEMYRTMCRIRRFEDRIFQYFRRGELPGTVHQYQGEEAVAAGVCANLNVDDYITSTHRPHGHAIAKGMSFGALIAELAGKRTGCCGGKGGSMHIGDPAVGMIPAIAIVAGGVPIAAGLALGSDMSGSGRVAACFFGDGATNHGAFHEGVNLAAVWNLPVVFVCENNLYAASTPIRETTRVTDLAKRMCAYGIDAVEVDGNDVEAVWQGARDAVDRARWGQGPTFLECKTYRRCGHSRMDQNNYRCKDEEEIWFQKDPISICRKRLVERGWLTEDAEERILAEIDADFDSAFQAAERSPYPSPEEALAGMYWQDGQ